MTSINPLQTTMDTGLKDQRSISSNNTAFKSAFDSAMNLLNETNSAIKDADQAALDFSLGKIDNIHEVMIAQEKASVALQYTVQLRDGFLDAYNEIMRMQV